MELLSERPGFRATPEQVKWLRAAGAANGFINLSDWLRHLAIVGGEAKLGAPYPPRKPLPPPQPPLKRRK